MAASVGLREVSGNSRDGQRSFVSRLAQILHVRFRRQHRSLVSRRGRADLNFPLAARRESHQRRCGNALSSPFKLVNVILGPFLPSSSSR